MPRPPVIALLTDFGLTDPYVAQMKAVLLSQAPGAVLLDISHAVRRHDILQGAFFLAATLPWLEGPTTVVAVVDPGVGTARRILYVRSRGIGILAPDNGLVSLLPDDSISTVLDMTPETAPDSATFHGRDVFAPLAARLACGADPQTLGRPWQGNAPVRLAAFEPVVTDDRIICRVLSVDAFGNVVLNLDTARFGAVPPGVALLAPVKRPLAPVSTYGAITAHDLGLLAGSQGYLELAANRGSAAQAIGCAPGDTLTIFWPGGPCHGTAS